MKKVYLFFVILLSGIIFTSCASIPKPLTDEPSEVSFYFKGNGASVLTFWKKLETADGPKSKRFSVGGNSRAALMMNMSFKKPYVQKIKLDPGIYYLDSFQIVTSGGYILSQGGHYSKRNGWDEAANAPLWLSFEVKPNKDIVLPEVEIVPISLSNDKNFEFEFKIDNDEDNVFTIGTGVKNSI